MFGLKKAICHKCGLKIWPGQGSVKVGLVLPECHTSCLASLATSRRRNTRPINVIRYYRR
jgi:hypothetical protein